jgi:hypothetical protein
MIARLRFRSLKHVHGCTINRQWLVAELPVLRHCFRISGIADIKKVSPKDLDLSVRLVLRTERNSSDRAVLDQAYSPFCRTVGEMSHVDVATESRNSPK